MNKSVVNKVLAFLGLTGPSVLFAAGGGIEIINWYAILLNKLGIHDDHVLADYLPVVGSLFITAFILLIGIVFKSRLEKSSDVKPDREFGLKTLMEVILEFVYSITKDNCGPAYKKYYPLMAAMFVTILFTNLSGLIPGFPPATESINTNLAMGLIVFLVYNLAGIKEHGFGYLKHFMGPVVFIAPIFFVIELVSHASRPFSLSIRLLANIFGDHLMLSVFTGLTYLVVPSLLMFFGLLVAVIQSFIFTLLSGIYVSMAISHDH